MAPRYGSAIADHYRARAPNARSHPTPAPSLEAHYRNEAIEPRTIVIFARYFRGMFYRFMRSLFSIHSSYIVWQCSPIRRCLALAFLELVIETPKALANTRTTLRSSSQGDRPLSFFLSNLSLELVVFV
jgi:hypothetical protein